MEPKKEQGNTMTVTSPQTQTSLEPSKKLKYLPHLLVVVAFTVIFTIVYSLVYPQKESRIAENSLGFPSVSPIPQFTPTPTQSSPQTSSTPLPNPPVSKIIPMRTHVFQTFNNCGPATLSMALSYFNQNHTQQVLGLSLRPYQNPQGDNDDKSVSLAEISAKAKEYGLISYHRPAGDLTLMKQFIAHDIPVITRTWLNLEEDISHYRLVRGYDDTQGVIIQDDSYTNKNLRFAYSEFLALWQSFNYEYIVIASPDKQAIVEQILGENLSEKSAWEKSLRLAEQELKADPNNFYATFNASIALYHLERYEDSVKAYESIQDKLPRRMLWYQLEPILAYYKLNNYDRVLSITDTILNNGNRAYSELYLLRAKIFESRGQTDLFNQSIALSNQYNTSSYWQENLR